MIPPHLEPYDLKGTQEYYKLRDDLQQLLVYDLHLKRFVETDHPEREGSSILEAALFTAENEKVINEIKLETMNRLVIIFQ